MFIQTRQTFQPNQNYTRPNSYFTQQNRQFGVNQSNDPVEEIHINENLD